MRQRPRSGRTPAPPLDRESLDTLALGYAARFATTRAKLRDYLRRKLRERGWEGGAPPDVEAVVARMAELRYVDDAAFATIRSDALARRGFGARRIAEALNAAGVEPEERAGPAALSPREAWAAAERFARRRRIGPFAANAADRPAREKHVAAFVRAGHDFATARAWVDAAPGEPPPGPDDGEQA